MQFFFVTLYFYLCASYINVHIAYYRVHSFIFSLNLLQDMEIVISIRKGKGKGVL